MNQAALAWAAFKNMMRASARDPLWPFVALLSAPLRIWRPLLGVLFFLIIALFVVGFGGRFFLQQMMGFGPGSIPFIALDLVTLLVLAALAFRFISQQHTARPLPAHGQLPFLAGQRPIVAAKLTYYADPEFKGAYDLT